MPQIIINGEAREIKAPRPLNDFLAELGLSSDYLAVAVNERVVPKSEHKNTTIKEGDRLEIIHAVGGG